MKSTFLSSDVAFARVLLWIRFPHLSNSPFPWLDLPTIEERLNAVIVLCLDNQNTCGVNHEL